MAKREKSRRVALDRNSVPRVACFVRAKTPLGVGLRELLAALQEFVDVHFAPVWGVSCRLVATKGFVKGAWAMAFLDDSDQASASAYHDLTPEGLPLAKVFVRTIRAHGEEVSVAASHELAEMLVDPAMNLMSTGPDPRPHVLLRDRRSGRVGVCPARRRDVRLRPSRVVRTSPRGSTRFDHPREGDATVPDAERRVPDRLRERRVEERPRLAREAARARARGPPAAPQRDARARGDGRAASVGMTSGGGIVTRRRRREGTPR
jgi:hypothetical protein